MKRIYLVIIALLLAIPVYGQNCSQEINPGSTRDCKFTTLTTTGAPTTLSGSPVIKAYKGNSTSTEVTTGISLTVDFDGITGLNNLHVDFSDAFYATGADITFVITTGTVGGTSVVGYTPWQTQIFDGPVLTTNGSSNLVSFFGNGAASSSAIQDNIGTINTKAGFLPSITAGSSGGLFVAGTNAATTITTGLTTHLIGTVDTLTTYTGNTVQTGDSYARIGAAGVSLTAIPNLTSLPKNTAFSSYPLFIALASNSNVGVTGATVSCVRSIDGGAFASTGLTGVAEVGGGTYTINWSAGATNGNAIVLRCTATGGSGTALIYRQHIFTQH